MVFLIFIGVIFFRAKKERSKCGDSFGLMINVAMINLIFDMITVYTVNHLDTVSPIINRICHDIFIETIVLCLFLQARYIYYMIQGEIGKEERMPLVLTLPVILSSIVIFFGPLDYMETDKGNYSYGLAAIGCYVCMAVYVLISCRYMIKYYRRIHPKKRAIIGLAICIYVLFAGYQAFVPTSLVSGFGLTLVVFSIFLTLESPDIHLIELLKIEKKRADDANTSKSQFLAQMSHEIRTPINAIIGMDEVILREYDEPQLNEYATAINNSATTLLGLINDVLDFSKIESGKIEIIPEEYSVSTMCRSLIDMIKPRISDKDIELITEVDERLPEKLYGDDTKIKQIITNLLTNAAKYTNEGSITFSLGITNEDEKEVTILISVEDTGIGIKQEDIPKLFESFVRIEENRNRNIEGTGLGMNITMQYLKLMGSDLKVESIYGKGSKFYFTIKQKRIGEELVGNFEQRYVELLKKGKKTFKDRFVAPEAKLLVVDDNETNRMVFASLLKNTKMDITLVDSGKRCLEEASKNFYHIIFLDHMMPEMDGIETLERLRDMKDCPCKDTPVIVLTANAIAGVKEEYIKTGFDNYLAKPVTLDKLENMILEYLPKDIICVPEDNIESNRVHRISDIKEDNAGDSIEGNYQESNDYSVTIVELLNRISGFDGEKAIENCSSEEILLQAIGTFNKMFENHIGIIDECLENLENEEYVKRYTIEVHGLKSVVRMIGGVYLGDVAQKLEDAGNAMDIEKIKRDTPDFIDKLRIVDYKLSICLPVKQVGEKEIDIEIFKVKLEQLSYAMSTLDIDVADEIIEEFSTYPWSCELDPLMKSLELMVTNLNAEGTEEVINNIKERIM